MAQPYSKLQETFKTGAAVPKIPALQDPELTFTTQTLCGQPVLYVKHKKPTQKVCVYVVGGGMLKYPKPSQAGDEVFSAAAESIRDRMEACGVHVTLEIGQGLFHCYAAMPLVPEAKPGYERMIAYLKA